MMGALGLVGDTIGAVGGLAVGSIVGAAVYGLDRLNGEDHDHAAKQFDKVATTAVKVGSRTCRIVGATGDLALTVISLGAASPPSPSDFNITR
jgi:hypothetical protein